VNGANLGVKPWEWSKSMLKKVRTLSAMSVTSWISWRNLRPWKLLRSIKTGRSETELWNTVPSLQLDHRNSLNFPLRCLWYWMNSAGNHRKCGAFQSLGSGNGRVKPIS
jgi:hypothetical protein